MSQNRGEAQPMQPCPALTGQLVWSFHCTEGQLKVASGPLHPILYRHQPLRAPSSPHSVTNRPAS